MWLLTVIYRIIIGNHTCVLRLEFRKYRIIYLATRTFGYRPIWRLGFWRLFYTLWLHFRLCYYTFIFTSFGRTLGLLFHLLYNVIFHFLITIWWLLNNKFTAYYFFVWWWIFIVSKDRFHFTTLYRYYLIWNRIILFKIILLIIVIVLFIFFFYNNVTHLLHNFLHHLFILRHLPFFLPIFIFINTLEYISFLLLIRVIYYF